MAPMRTHHRIHLQDLNSSITCPLCNGYLIEATALIECDHVFCRGCILRHLESGSKSNCPSCSCSINAKKSRVNQNHNGHQQEQLHNHNDSLLRPDPQLQALVYKLVPGLYSKEMQRREDFYRSTAVRASSSCSDDSVLERERDLIEEEKSIASLVGDRTQFFGPDDLISLSLEYYREVSDDKKELNRTSDLADAVSEASDVKVENEDTNKHNMTNGNVQEDKRYLQCPAAVTMSHLQKFIRMKFALTVNHRVDIIYDVEVLPAHFTLMDVAYTFKWKRLEPMRFFYRIFTPLKIQPIKIVNTVMSGGEKQLQIVPSSPKCSPPLTPNPSCSSSANVSSPAMNRIPTPAPAKREENEEKEHLLANLELQSRTKAQVQSVKFSEPPPLVVKLTDTKTNTDEGKKKESSNPPIQDCVFEYEEPDKEEIKRFAEIRDREWAMQKKLDESMMRRQRADDDYHHHVSKKRKKNKHKTSRKLHAEITNKEEELKLKVKLTSPHNGHKHKHHKSSSSSLSTVDVSSKEKLLQMRQIRHKQVTASENKTTTVDSPFRAESPPDSEWTVNKVPTVHIERNEQAEKQVKKAVKSYQGPCYKPPPTPPTNAPQTAPLKALKSASIVPPPRTFPPNLERKLANLQQRCTVETKPSPTSTPLKTSASVKKYSPLEVTKVNSPVSSGAFTVSKVDNQSLKRKQVDGGNIDGPPDKRPSLEITLINPNPSSSCNKSVSGKPTKRPPPPPIPLDRIKRSYSAFNKSGISIIAKPNNNNNNKEKCDNIGALDLSSKILGSAGAPEAIKKDNTTTITSGATPKPNGFVAINKDKPNISNLQMLSKVATEASLNGGTSPKPVTSSNANKPRPPMPSLQTLKIPTPPQQRQIPNLDKLPKLTEINKLNPQQFRLLNASIRNLRPNNQNQNIRNIPNPSLLIRQQNQNRLNSLGNNREVVMTPTSTVSSTASTNAVQPPVLTASKGKTADVKPNTVQATGTELIPC